MNFDDLKKEWNETPARYVRLSEGVLRTKKSFSILEKLRKKMRKDFYNQIAAMFLVLLLPVLFPSSYLVIVVLYAVMLFNVIVTVYYFFRFHIFYKKIAQYDLSLKKSLYQITYKLELNIELYKLLTYCISLSLLPLLILLYMSPLENLQMETREVITFFISFFTAIVFIYFLVF